MKQNKVKWDQTGTMQHGNSSSSVACTGFCQEGLNFRGDEKKGKVGLPNFSSTPPSPLKKFSLVLVYNFIIKRYS